jgi:hypothetical protein
MLVQLRVDEEVDEGVRGRGTGRKAATALPGKLKPQGALQEAAVKARTVSITLRAEPQSLGRR